MVCSFTYDLDYKKAMKPIIGRCRRKSERASERGREGGREREIVNCSEIQDLVGKGSRGVLFLVPGIFDRARPRYVLVCASLPPTSPCLSPALFS